MKICLVNLRSLPVLAPGFENERVGGEEVQFSLIASALTRRGHDVSLVVGDYGQPDGAIHAGVKTIKAFREGAGLPVVRYVYPRWVKLWRALQRADADVYYVSCAGMEVGLLAMFCRAHGKALVFRTASDSDCDPARLLVRFWRDRQLYHYGLRRADAILVQSEVQRELLGRNYGLDGTPARMLVDRTPVTATPTPKDIDVLWVANLRHVKRPDRVLEFAACLPHVRIHMAGGVCPGEEALYARVEAAAKALPNLTFHGTVAYRAVGRLFDRARLFINTSELEGFPNTFLQAWVRGVPVIATFDPDEILARERLGLPVADVAAMTEAIAELLADDGQYQRARQRCQAYMARLYDEDDLLRPYVDAMTRACHAVTARITTA